MRLVRLAAVSFEGNCSGCIYKYFLYRGEAERTETVFGVVSFMLIPE